MDGSGERPVNFELPGARGVQFGDNNTQVNNYFLGIDQTAAAAAIPAADVPDFQSGRDLRVSWFPEADLTEHFTGRTELLSRLGRWAGEPEVSVIAVTGFGGAGKTTLVTHWSLETDGVYRRPGIRGVFGWNFYADPSAENWAAALLAWAADQFGVAVNPSQRLPAAVLALLRTMPVVLVLDGLEVVQEGPGGGRFGRLLDGALREVLSGACRQRLAGLILLTSRFTFADFEMFYGSSARMLEATALSVAEGSALMAAAGGDWLPDGERRELVRAVDGHALAVGVIASLLADRVLADDLAALRAELVAETRTSERVGRVVRFYAGRLSAADRYLVAGIALFSRPVAAQTVLAVAAHPAFDGSLAGWTPDEVLAAARDRLSGLVSCMHDGTMVVHPLVRESFRPLVLGAAEVAADVALDALPSRVITSQETAIVVVECVELLVAAGQWTPAHELYRGASSGGQEWKHLPAVGLGKRAAGAFVASQERREACLAALGEARLGDYLGSVAVFAMFSGDLEMAAEFADLAISSRRRSGDKFTLCVDLQTKVWCLGQRGDLDGARSPADEALAAVQSVNPDRRYDITVANTKVWLGWLAMLSGDTESAEELFMDADEMEYGLQWTGLGDHLTALRGTVWAEYLIRTERFADAARLTRANLTVCERNGWNEDIARCNRIFGRLAMAEWHEASAGAHFAAAAESFRAGDFLTELAVTLTDLAEHARVTGQLEAADQHATEAISIAAPRGLVLAQSAALAVRARIRADQAAATGSADVLEQGRDAASAALRLATSRGLAWHELDALRAHAALDAALDAEGGTTGDYADQADELQSRLVDEVRPWSPLGTVERRVAEWHWGEY